MFRLGVYVLINAYFLLDKCDKNRSVFFTFNFKVEIRRNLKGPGKKGPRGTGQVKEVEKVSLEILFFLRFDVVEPQNL